MQKKRLYLFIAIGVIQLLLSIVAFNRHFNHPDNFMFQNQYDGYKNYYTFHAYVNQDEALGYSRLMTHNYPYGDIIFFTDNSPIIAVVVKFIHHHIIPVGNHSIAVYNSILIFIHWLTALFLFYFLSKLLKNNYLALVFAIIFSWIHPQMPRLAHGVFNLSLALPIIMSLYYCLQIYKANRWSHWLKLAIIIIISTFIHFYYLAILGVLIGLFAFTWSIKRYFFQHENALSSLRPLLNTTCTLGISASLILGFVQWIDLFSSQRLKAATGFDYEPWSIRLSSLITPYEWYGINNILFTKTIPSVESHAYLGSMMLYGTLLFVILKWLKSSYHVNLVSLFEKNIEGQFLYFLQATALLTLSISIGINIDLFQSDYRFLNITNLFLYVKKVYTGITQFRCLNRFFWITFWIWALSFAYIIDGYWYKFKGQKNITVLICGLLLLGIADSKDMIRLYNRIRKQNIFNTDTNKEVVKIPTGINTKDYQALLPIPLYYLSTEKFEYVIDGETINYNSVVAAYSDALKIPMVAMQSSRTPLYQAENLFNMLLNADTTNINQQTWIKDLPNEKPMLIMLDKQVYKDESQGKVNFNIPVYEPAKTVVLQGNQFVKKMNMKLIAENERWAFYEWKIAK